MICFWNYRLQKAALLKSMKSPVAEHLCAVNMLIAPKHCLNQHGCSFVIIFDDFKRKSSGKILF